MADFEQLNIESRIFALEQKLRRHRHTGTETEKLGEGSRDVLMSFETGEQTATKIYFPFKVQIIKLRGIVMLAIAGTDTGTITGANADGNSTGGVITAAISAALNTEYTASPTSNVIVEAGSFYKLTSAKTTAGGRVLVSIEFERR